MDTKPLTIVPVRVWDMWKMTRMAYRNMVGVDVEFTRYAGNPLLRALGYLFIPIYLLTSGRGYKAILDDEIVGCAFLNLRRRSGLIFNVNVNPDFRRQGIGTRLMEHVEAQIGAGGRSWAGLQVDEGNKPAEKLYRQLGYRPYHDYFLRRTTHTSTPINTPDNLHISRLRNREGHRLFFRYSKIEREAGDNWAARVVTADYDDGPPPGGTFWRCSQAQEEIGTAWLGSPGHHPTVILLLRPPVWDQHQVTLGFLPLLLSRAGTIPGSLDLHVGSSAHHAVLAEQLQNLGFVPQRRARILMLKSLR